MQSTLRALLLDCFASLAMTEYTFRTYSELHRRRSLDLGPGRTEIEKFLAGEAERAGEQRRGHLLDAGIVLLHRIVEEAAAGGDLVFEVGELALQLLEV